MCRSVTVSGMVHLPALQSVRNGSRRGDECVFVIFLADDDSTELRYRDIPTMSRRVSGLRAGRCTFRRDETCWAVVGYDCVWCHDVAPALAHLEAAAIHADRGVGFQPVSVACFFDLVLAEAAANQCFAGGAMNRDSGVAPSAASSATSRSSVRVEALAGFVLSRHESPMRIDVFEDETSKPFTLTELRDVAEEAAEGRPIDCDSSLHQNTDWPPPRRGRGRKNRATDTG